MASVRRLGLPSVHPSESGEGRKQTGCGAGHDKAAQDARALHNTAAPGGRERTPWEFSILLLSGRRSQLFRVDAVCLGVVFSDPAAIVRPDRSIITVMVQDGHARVLGQFPELTC